MIIVSVKHIVSKWFIVTEISIQICKSIFGCVNIIDMNEIDLIFKFNYFFIKLVI